MMQPVVGRVLCVWLALICADRATAAPQRDVLLKDLQQLEQRIQQDFREKDYTRAEADCRRLIELAPSAAAYYNLACALARQDKKDEAFKALRKSVALGEHDAAHLKADEDLAALRQDPRFAAIVKQAEENERKALGAAEKAADIAGVRTIENEVEGGLRYRLRISPTARKEKPQRLIVWLHPSGGSMNNVVEQLSPRLNRHGYALLVFTRKSLAGWSGDDIPKLDRTLQALATIDGLDVRQPLLLGYSAGGQMAMILWRQGLERWGGLVLDAAYPIDPSVVPPRVLPPPKTDKAARQTPVLVLVGTRDGGAQVWKQVTAAYREAGVPLSVEYVEGKGHTWLLGSEQTQRLMAWLDEVSAGKLPATTVGKPPQAGDANRPVLGVVLDGVKVTQIAPGSPAEKAGLKEGDLIESVDGKSVASREELAAAIAAKKPGDAVTLRIDRNGQRHELLATFPRRVHDGKGD